MFQFVCPALLTKSDWQASNVYTGNTGWVGFKEHQFYTLWNQVYNKNMRQFGVAHEI